MTLNRYIFNFLIGHRFIANSIIFIVNKHCGTTNFRLKKWQILERKHESLFLVNMIDEQKHFMKSPKIKAYGVSNFVL